MVETFRGITALVTGASAGLGSEFCRQLAPHAGRLILVARRADRLAQIKEELSGSPCAIEIWPADLADESQLDALSTRIMEEASDLGLLVNNAGLGDYGSIATADWHRIRQMLRVNIEGLVKLTHGTLPLMLQKGRGYILNVSSVAGMAPMPMFGVYGATKAFVTSFTEALRIELRRDKIHATALCPGPTPSEFGTVATRGESGVRPSSPSFFRMPPERVVRAGLEGVARNKARVIPGGIVAAAMLTAEIIPKPLQRLILNLRARG